MSFTCQMAHSLHISVIQGCQRKMRASARMRTDRTRKIPERTFRGGGVGLLVESSSMPASLDVICNAIAGRVGRANFFWYICMYQYLPNLFRGFLSLPIAHQLVARSRSTVKNLSHAHSLTLSLSDTRDDEGVCGNGICEDVVRGGDGVDR